MRLEKLEMPKRLDVVKESFTDTYGKFVAEPFERGYAITIGNSLRRILLSSVGGAAVTSVKFDGVLHEFTNVRGVLEDVNDILLNIKDLKLRLLVDGPKKIRINVQGEKEVKAADIEDSSEVEILNKDLHIATLTSRDAKLDMEMEVNHGRGYSTAEKNKREDQAVGVIPVDSIFTPVTRVKFGAETARVGQMTDYDKLIVEIWTDGRIKPDDALAHAGKILKDHMTIFINFEEEPEEEPEEKVEEDAGAESEKIGELLSKNVEDLDLSVRSVNCLKGGHINTLGELVRKDTKDLLKYRHFGEKSLDEVKDILVGMGLRLGMTKEEVAEISGKTK